jgi:hypothetical protein
MTKPGGIGFRTNWGLDLRTDPTTCKLSDLGQVISLVSDPLSTKWDNSLCLFGVTVRIKGVNVQKYVRLPNIYSFLLCTKLKKKKTNLMYPAKNKIMIIIIIICISQAPL